MKRWSCEGGSMHIPLGLGDTKARGGVYKGRNGFYIMGGCIVTEQMDGSGLELVYQISKSDCLRGRAVGFCGYSDLVHSRSPVSARGLLEDGEDGAGMRNPSGGRFHPPHPSLHFTEEEASEQRPRRSLCT